MIKKIGIFTVTLLLLFAFCSASALAEEGSFTYLIETTSGGQQVTDLSALPAGSEVTVSVSLTRTDIAAGATYEAWALQMDIYELGMEYVSGTGFTLTDDGETGAVEPLYSVGGATGTIAAQFIYMNYKPSDTFTIGSTITVSANYVITDPAAVKITVPVPIIYLGGDTTKQTNITDVTPPSGGGTVAPAKYTVSFNAAGGTVSGSSTVQVDSGASIVLPNAVKDNCTFQGWSDGSKTYAAGSSYTVTGNVTFTALWQDNGPIVPTGTVTVKPAGEGSINEDGTISVTASGPVQVKVTGVSSGQVVAVVDGAGRVTDIIEKSLVENGAAYFCLPGSAKVKIINNAASFSDVRSSDWYASAVTFASSHELFSGMGNGVFAPGAQMTRGMLVTVLWRLEDKPAAASALSFSDVASGDYFYTAVQWAAANGIVKGYTDGSFQPNKSITREEMAALLNRYMDYLGRDTSVRGDLSRFSDGDKVSAWAADNLSWANGAGVITGRPDGTVDPQGTATRAEVAAMLQRIVSALVK